MLEAAAACPACGAARYESTPTGSFEKHEGLSTAKQPTAVAPPRSTTKEAAGAQPEWRCPKCRSENVQRLSVIYSEGTTSTRQGIIGLGLGGAGGAVGGGTSSTIMAEGVAPPTTPTAPQPPDTADNSAGIGCLVFVLVGFLALLTSGVIAMALSDHYPNASPGGLFLLVVGISVSLGVWASGSAARAYKQSQEAKRQPELAAYNEALSTYNEAMENYNESMAKWQRSYFCHRCGNVFELQSS